MSSTSTQTYNALDYQKYSNPIPNRDFILKLLEQSNKTLNRQQLIEALELSGDDQIEGLRRRLRAMERDGQITFSPRQGYTVLQQKDLIEGRIIGHRDGFGFLTQEGVDDDLYLHNAQMRKVFDGDLVQVRVTGQDRRGRNEISIIKVLEHNTTQLVGRIGVKNNQYYLQPENGRISNEISVAKAHLNGAKQGQYVVVQITNHPFKSGKASGQVHEVLGDSAGPGLKIDVTLRSHNIPNVWPVETTQTAKGMGSEVKADDKLHRVDMTNKPFVTIDGEDARDFDDAVYCEPHKNDGWRLFVAIADVSHYVLPDSPLDQEAQKRGTSVYFPGHVVPMLPETLSNGLCSLNPHVDRLVMVCEMTITREGKMTDWQFSEAVINSHARLTYNTVSTLLANPESVSEQQVPNSVRPHLVSLHQLYKVLQKARASRGSIDFETNEVTFQYNKQQKITQINPVVRNDAHKLIEECMLCANVATARFLQKLKLPALYRVHEGPQPKKLTNLRAFLDDKGLTMGGGDKPTPAHYNELLSTVAKRGDAQVIQTMLLRSLGQAVYSPDNQGHFGLAYSAYAHFTSPIRRYPDLLVHRAIRSVIREKQRGGSIGRLLKSVMGFKASPVVKIKTAKPLKRAQSYPYVQQDIETLSSHCSQASRRADKAGLDVEAWLKCEYMQSNVGKVFSGFVSSVTNFGLFVELDNIGIDGLIPVMALGKDSYHFDSVKQCLTGKESNQSFGLGDKITIEVTAIDMSQRKIAFGLASQS
jgi:ribonuclease R